MVNEQNQFQVFEIHRNTLIQLITRCKRVFQTLDVSSKAESLTKLSAKVESDRFKVMVLGEFKRGKSTVINALLGEEVLPAYAVPTTAVINEIKWGTEPQATLYFHHPLPEKLPPIPKEAQVHIQRASGNPVPPLEISPSELEDYVVIRDPAQDQAKSVAETPYSNVTLHWPVEICRNGVEVIDSPGLNEHGTRTKVTESYLPHADAILFVMTCSALASQSEMTFIERYLLSAGHEQIFFICNRFDEVRRAKDRERIINFGRRKLEPYTKLKTTGIFFVSALQALDGRLEEDPRLVEKSGFLPLENALRHFLANERGKIKVLQPIRELTYELQEAKNSQLSQREALSRGLAELEAKYQQVIPRLQNLERSKKQTIRRIENYRESLERQVRLETAQFLRKLADDIPSWVAGLKTEHNVPLFAVNHKYHVEALVQEITQQVSEYIDERTNQWSHNTLTPLVENTFEEMTDELKEQVDRFQTQLDDIRTVFSGVEQETSTASGAEKFFTAVAGDVFSAAHGARFGFDGLLTSIGVQIGIAIVAVLVGVTNPWLIVGALFSSGLISALMKAGALTDKVKEETGKKVAEHLLQEQQNTIENTTEKVDAMMAKFQRAAESYLDGEIQAVEEMVESVLRDKRAGETQVRKKQAILNRTEKEINSIDHALKDLMFAVNDMAS